jgi:hypothetical protein
MAHPKKLALPLLSDLLPPLAKRAPRVEAARAQLGGRASTGPGAGRVVAVESSGAAKVGVVLFESPDEVDVFFADGTVRRARPEELGAPPPSISEPIARAAADACVFARLAEGQKVRYEAQPGTFAHGTLVEKCRYGALVLRDDGKIMAIGFRRMWPVSGESEPS